MQDHILQTDPVGYEDDLNLYAYVRNDPLNLVDPTGKCSSVQDEDKRNACLDARAAATEQATDYLEGQSTRQGADEPAYIATWNEETGEVNVRTGDAAGDRSNYEVEFTNNEGEPLIASRSGRIFREDEDGERQRTNDIVLVTGHGHPSDRGDNARLDSLDRANSGLRGNTVDGTLSEIAPAAILSPSGQVRVYEDRQDSEDGAMKAIESSFVFAALFIGFLGLSACSQIQPGGQNILLSGYDESNYALLGAATGQRVCIVGDLSVDAHGVWFLLEPYERNGVLEPSPSRVRVDFSQAERGVQRLRDGEQQRICGSLSETTLRDRCTHNRCRSYALTEAQVS